MKNQYYIYENFVNSADGNVRLHVQEEISADFKYITKPLKEFIESLSEIDNCINDAIIATDYEDRWGDTEIFVEISGWRLPTDEELTWYKTEKEKRASKKKADAKAKREANKIAKQKQIDEAIALLSKEKPDKLKELIDES